MTAGGVLKRYPVDLVLEGVPCVVIGGGRVAARKVRDLVACGARVTVVAPEVCEEIRATPGVRVLRREYRPGDLEGQRLVLTAVGEREVVDAVAAEAEARGLWMNAADDPERCSFTLPAVLRRGDLLVTVSTSGKSPALARWLRDRLADEVGPEFEVLLDILAEEREARRAAGQSSVDLDWPRALESGILELVRQGHLAEAKERLQACLS
ncbi:MAG: precorrin-2 dehydrogenase [Acidimicrobiales bacterium]|nr:MAG: precorrin-2 dehydrogenase [Acidimicrobiales bacterium]